MKKNKFLCYALSFTLGLSLFIPSALAVNAEELTDSSSETENSSMSHEALRFEVDSVSGYATVTEIFRVYGIGGNDIEYTIADETIAEVVEDTDENYLGIALLKAGTTTLSAKTSDGRTAEIDITVLEEEPTVCITWGDLTGDTSFDLADVICLQKFLLGYDVQIVNISEADFNRDGQINIFDLCALKQELIRFTGWH